MKYLNATLKYIILFALVVFMLLGLKSGIARGMLALIFCAIIYCSFRCIKYLSRIEICAIFVLLAVNTFYFLFSDVGRHSGFYANIVLNLGIFFFSHHLSSKGRLNEKEIIVTYILLLIATSYRFFVEEAEMLIENNDKRETMNLAYAFVIYMPYVFYIKNKILSVVLVLFALFMVLNGAKRGAIVIYLVTAIYYIYYGYIRESPKIKFKYIIIAIIGIIIAIHLAKNIYIDNTYLQNRFEQTLEGNANGRENIYTAIWNKWINEQNFFCLLFGYGFCSSVDIAGNRAHNDWLEMMATAGFVGEVTYIFYLTNLFRVRNRIKDVLDKRVINLILLILVTKSFFSMSYCSVDNMAIFLLLGYVTGKNRRNIQQNIILPDSKFQKQGEKVTT